MALEERYALVYRSRKTGNFYYEIMRSNIPAEVAFTVDEIGRGYPDLELISCNYMGKTGDEVTRSRHTLVFQGTKPLAAYDD